MSASPRRLVARHVHELVERQRLDVLTDEALLSRFCMGRDDEVFATLVRRHGSMVLGVCRRILRHAQDAEDACQATFLVLARKGRAIHRGDSLPGWLHRVAVRVASRFRRDRSRRIVESLPAELEIPATARDESVRHEIRQAFDAEIGKLPARFRLPLILCCLQGKSRSEAAAELGWSVDALRGRLERGRKLLRSRFARLGLALPVGLSALFVEQPTSATGVSALVSPSSAATRMADSVLRSMVVARIKFAALATAAVLMLGAATGLGLYSTAAAQPKAGAAPPVTSTPAAADAEKNLDTFILRIALAPAGRGQLEPRFSLYQVLLYVPNLRLEPPVKGLDGKPSELHARISKEQARKIMDALGRFDFFKDDSARQDPWTRKLCTLQPALAAKWPHVGLAIRFQNGEDAAQVERLLAWLPQMLPPLDAIRGCVDGDAGKSLDELLKQLADDRNKWAPDPFAADLKQLQGSWIAENRDTILRVPVATTLMSKCTIEGKNIVLKPVVQRNPLFDLETIRGEFELTPGKPGTMTIKGVRDTVSKQESDAWTCHYEVTDSTLKILLPQAGTMPSAGMQPNVGKGERAFEFKRALAGQTSDWGESSNGVQLRLRSPNNTYLAGEVPTFDLDVRSEHPRIAGKSWDWLAPRVESFARVEVDGVWYRSGDPEVIKVTSRELGLSQTIESWVKVHLADNGWVEETTKSGELRHLALKPGKHRVRVGYSFRSSEGGKVADPLSGAMEIEVRPPAPK